MCILAQLAQGSPEIVSDLFTLHCTRVFQPFCQKLKIQKVTPLRFWIGSNGFQKVQKLENLSMLKGAHLQFLCMKQIHLKGFLDVNVFT